MAHWQFRPLNPNENSGSSTVDDNFADEERTSVEILVRETLQNPLDARSGSGLVRVRYKVASLEVATSAFARAIFTDDWAKHFPVGLATAFDSPRKISFLVVEDFGTTGLEGCYEDSSREGRTENWNAFWFREGEGAKPTKSNGGAGQGKITLYLASAMRSVFALTKRASDGKELLFGCCRFRRNYKLANEDRRWAKEARWGATRNPEDLARPIVDSALIAAAKADLGLLRGDAAGTSFLVPMPIEVSESAIREAVINEFFFAIRRGRLEVQVGDETLTKDTISAAADSLGSACRLTKSFRNFLELATQRCTGQSSATARESWASANKLTEAAFSADDLQRLKDLFELSEPLSVDFPLSVKSKESGKTTRSTFRVILQQEADADQSQELFVRQDLGIDGEKRLRASRSVQPVCALTFIEQSELSDLLVAAEEPTHRNWNARRPKVQALYANPEKALNGVRNAALRLVQLIAPAGKRDETALALYFADPSSSDIGRKGAEGVIQNPVNPDKPPIPPIPPPKPKPISVNPLADGFSVRAASNQDLAEEFPLQCDVEIAYATATGNSYQLWDAADFWINDESQFPVAAAGIECVERDGNTISFVLTGPDSAFAISGFDKNRQLDVRVKYKRVGDGPDIEDN